MPHGQPRGQIRRHSWSYVSDKKKKAAHEYISAIGLPKNVSKVCEHL